MTLQWYSPMVQLFLLSLRLLASKDFVCSSSSGQVGSLGRSAVGLVRSGITFPGLGFKVEV